MENTEFNTWLLQPENVQKYQGITKEKFGEIFANAQEEAKAIASAIFGDDAVAQVESDTADKRLDQMIKDGDVLELNGLYFRDKAVQDAKAEYERL